MTFFLMLNPKYRHVGPLPIPVVVTGVKKKADKKKKVLYTRELQEEVTNFYDNEKKLQAMRDAVALSDELDRKRLEGLQGEIEALQAKLQQIIADMWEEEEALLLLLLS